MPVFTVRAKCWPKAGWLSLIFASARLSARVTFTRARSACDPARRSRPPSPTARARDYDPFALVPDAVVPIADVYLTDDPVAVIE